MADYMRDDGVIDEMDCRYLMEIEDSERRIEGEKKKFRKAVSGLQSADKRLRAAKQAAEDKSTARAELRLENANAEMELAVALYKESNQALDSIIENVRTNTEKLARSYYDLGKRRSAKKINQRYNRFFQKQQRAIVKISENCVLILENYEREKNLDRTDRGEREASQRYRESRAPQYADVGSYKPAETGYPQYPQGQPVYYPAPPFYHDPYAARQSVSISPVSINVNEIVEEAVRSTMDKFIAALNERIAEYLNENPKPQNAQNGNPSNEEASQNNNGALAESKAAAAVETVIGEQKFVAQKLGELMNDLKAVMDNVNALSSDCMSITDKQKEASELNRALADSQRSLLRELQGVQVKQKLVVGEQEALIEEQTVAVEHQKIVTENQKALAEEQKAAIEGANEALAAQKAISEALKEIANAQKQLILQSEKNAELQKELTLKQQELIAKEKETISLHKQIMRAQRADEKRRASSKQKAIPEADEKKSGEKPSVEEEISLEEIAVEA